MRRPRVIRRHGPSYVNADPLTTALIADRLGIDLDAFAATDLSARDRERVVAGVRNEEFLTGSSRYAPPREWRLVVAEAPDCHPEASVSVEDRVEAQSAVDTFSGPRNHDLVVHGQLPDGERVVVCAEAKAGESLVAPSNRRLPLPARDLHNLVTTVSTRSAGRAPQPPGRSDVGS